MSQLTINPISSKTISSSPSGLVRTSNVVTVVVTGAPTIPFTVGQTANITGSSAVNGNFFDGSYPIATIVSTTSFTYNQTAPDDTGGGGTAYILGASFTDLADSALTGGSVFTQDDAFALNGNSKFGAVRRESFTLGFFASGNVVPTPVSPVDGYQYSTAECIYVPIFASSRQPAGGFVPGQLNFPTLANSDVGTGDLQITPYVLYVDRDTGILQMNVYFSTSGSAAQGTALVLCHGQRGSSNA